MTTIYISLLKFDLKVGFEKIDQSMEKNTGKFGGNSTNINNIILNQNCTVLCKFTAI